MDQLHGSAGQYGTNRQDTISAAGFNRSSQNGALVCLICIELKFTEDDISSWKTTATNLSSPGILNTMISHCNKVDKMEICASIPSLIKIISSRNPGPSVNHSDIMCTTTCDRTCSASIQHGRFGLHSVTEGSTATLWCKYSE